MNKNCAVYRTADFVGKKWTMLILLEIHKGETGTKRYSEIKRSVPDITPKILSLRLKELEKKGMIKKIINASVFPVRCDYSLTKKGADFVNVIKRMKKWALKWNIKNKICEKTDCETCVL